jgi:hypothetical protein
MREEEIHIYQGLISIFTALCSSQFFNPDLPDLSDKEFVKSRAALINLLLYLRDSFTVEAFKQTLSWPTIRNIFNSLH